SSWGDEETTMSAPNDGYAHSAVAEGDDVHLVYLHDWPEKIQYNKRTYGTGWGTEVTIQADAVDYMAPVLSIDTASGDLYCFWAGSPEANKIYYKKQVSESWDADPTLWLDETSDGFPYGWYNFLTCVYQAYNNKIGLLYTTKTASPYNVKFDFLQLAAQPPTMPVLVSPENNHSTYDNTPTFTWTAGGDATSHRLVIDNDSTFSDGDNIYDNANLGATATTCTIEDELPPDNYWWKVAAVANSTENWSENTWTFEITA
ncbi:unnamed protein product, partial [marine sediment metagenome]